MTDIHSRPIAGRLEGIGIPDVLWMLAEKRGTGLLRIECDGMETTLHFEEGRIIFASSTDPNDRLSVHLLRQGQVTLAQLEQVAEHVDSGARLRQILVEEGVLTHANLISVVLDQIKSIVLDLFTLREGGYYFDEQALPTDEAITLGCHVKELILVGIKQVNSQSLFAAQRVD
jgi:hypothetical protein